MQLKDLLRHGHLQFIPKLKDERNKEEEEKEKEEEEEEEEEEG